MNHVERPSKGIQSFSALLLCRCVLFFCGETPLTAVYALGTLLSIAAVGILSLPLALCNGSSSSSHKIIYRIAGIYTAAVLLSELYGMLLAQQAPYPALTFVPILLAVCYGLTLPRRTTGRAASLLMFLLTVGLMILLFFSFYGGQPMQLYTPARHSLAQCFWQAMGQNLPLAFLPLCVEDQPAALRRNLLLRTIGSLPVLALLIAAGAWCSGRLTQWEGNPFLLLVARSQGNSAIRIDGFWTVLIPAMSVTAIVFCLQIVIGRTPESVPSRGETLLPIGISAAGAILFIMHDHLLWLRIFLLSVCLGLLPLLALLRRKRSMKHGS